MGRLSERTGRSGGGGHFSKQLPLFSAGTKRAAEKTEQPGFCGEVKRVPAPEPGIGSPGLQGASSHNRMNDVLMAALE